jgi:hypothetical protein
MFQTLVLLPSSDEGKTKALSVRPFGQATLKPGQQKQQVNLLTVTIYVANNSVVILVQ